MSVLIASYPDIVAQMSDEPIEHKIYIIGAILPNRKILAGSEDNQGMLEGALRGLDENTEGKKLSGDELIDELYFNPALVGRGIGVRRVEPAEAREILTKAGII